MTCRCRDNKMEHLNILGTCCTTPSCNMFCLKIRIGLIENGNWKWLTVESLTKMLFCVDDASFWNTCSHHLGICPKHTRAKYYSFYHRTYFYKLDESVLMYCFKQCVKWYIHRDESRYKKCRVLSTCTVYVFLLLFFMMCWLLLYVPCIFYPVYCS